MSADKIDMSLEDIIKKNRAEKKVTSVGRRGRGGQRGFRGGKRRISRGGGNAAAGGRRSTSGRGRNFSRGRSGTFSSRTPDNRNAKVGGSMVSGGNSKLIVSNLDFGVSDSDVTELFSEFGRLRSAAVHYDRSGRSLGTADVIFERRTDAIRAMKQYNGVPLDGRAMQILIGSSDTQMSGGGDTRRISGGRVSPQKRNSGQYGKKFPVGRVEKRNSVRGGRRGRGGRTLGGRGGGRKRSPVPSAQELDNELDTYLKAR